MMKHKKVVPATEAAKEIWKRRIMLEKEYDETCAQWMVERIAALTEHMQYGHALIAYYKQTGEFQLVTATLIYYESDFRKAYDASQIRSAVVYWNTELQGWRSFQVENFLEWKPII